MVDIYSLATVAGWALVIGSVAYALLNLDWAAFADPAKPAVAAPAAIDSAKPVDLMIVAHRACVAAGLQESAGYVAAGISAALKSSEVLTHA